MKQPRLMIKRRGGVLVLMAATLALVLGAAASAIDVGAALQSRTKQQVADDAAVMAAASAMGRGGGTTAARAAALDWAGRNGVALAAADVSFTSASNGDTTIAVHSHQDVATTFARALGVPSLGVGAGATASVRGVGELPSGSLPLGLPAYQDPHGGWHVLSNPGGPYVDPTSGPPPTFELVLPDSNGGHNGCGQEHGSCVPLAPEGGCHDDYERCVTHGQTSPQHFGCCLSRADTADPGGTCRCIGERMTTCGDAVIPLVDRDDFERGDPSAPVHVVGCMGVTLKGTTCDGHVIATYQPQVVPAHAESSGTCHSIGVCTASLSSR